MKYSQFFIIIFIILIIVFSFLIKLLLTKINVLSIYIFIILNELKL